MTLARTSKRPQIADTGKPLNAIGIGAEAPATAHRIPRTVAPASMDIEHVKV